MRKYYVFKIQIYNPGTSTYMEDLSGEHLDEYYKAMDAEIQSLMRRETWDIVAYHIMLTGTWFFKSNRKPYWTIRIL